MQDAHFDEGDIDYLRQQTDRTGQRVFDEDFLKWLGANGTFDGITMHAIPEGRVVHPNEPLTVVMGPMVPAQILETSLLNHLNYQTLIATKAARMHRRGRSTLIDLGLRRGQDKGANAAVRAALIGGADFTSNVGMSRVLGYAPKGTHAHSMVQVFMALGMGELDAFRAYAEVYPDDCLLLVDTIDTLHSGIPNAITIFEELRRQGLSQGMGWIWRLAYLAIQAAKMLDDAGFRMLHCVVE
jgi:nicotinate phosphoribosyltransferase